MQTTTLILIAMLLPAVSLANTVKYTYENEAGRAGSIEIYDVPTKYGEEKLTWQNPADDKTMSLKLLSATPDSYEASLSIQSNAGEQVADLNFSLSFEDSFAQFQQLIKQKDFRDSFTYLPENCDEAGQVGFLLIGDNITSDLKGYCLKAP